jgi:hypothetical protein
MGKNESLKLQKKYEVIYFQMIAAVQKNKLLYYYNSRTNIYITSIEILTHLRITHNIIFRKYLERTFNHRWMDTRGPVQWPPKSPDLTPLDFFYGNI